MNLQQTDVSFQSPIDKISLGATYVFPEKPIGIIQFVHGMAEHKECYYPTTKKRFPRMRHEILLEKDSALVLDYILKELAK